MRKSYRKKWNWYATGKTCDADKRYYSEPKHDCEGNYQKQEMPILLEQFRLRGDYSERTLIQC
jgi:hypothetical protein